MKSSASIVILILILAAACSGAQTGADGPDKTEGTSAESGDFAVCGDQVREGSEVCDGPDLGGQACADLPGFTAGTLACAADCTAFDTSMCDADPTAAIVRLNEVTSTEIEDGTYAGAGDAIELVNIGMAAADLSGWSLSDDAGFAADKTYMFPDGSSLAPGEYLVLVKLDEVTMVGDYPFGISSTNPETLQLADASGTIVESVDFVGSDAVVSWCRLPDGDGTWQSCSRTFGESNEPGIADSTTEPMPTCGDGMRDGDEACDGDDVGGLGCTDVSSNFGGGTLACTAKCTFDTAGCELAGDTAVVLNELTSSDDDEIEIYNAGTRPADISGWILTDDLVSPDDAYDPEADLEKLVFADGTTIAPGEFLVVPRGEMPGHPFGLSADGEGVTLLDASTTVVDFTSYGANQAVVSYCRIPDGPTGTWQADCTATFGASNG